MRILRNEGGHQPPPQRRRYVDCNQPILRIVDDFPNCQRIDYVLNFVKLQVVSQT